MGAWGGPGWCAGVLARALGRQYFSKQDRSPVVPWPDLCSVMSSPPGSGLCCALMVFLRNEEGCAGRGL